MNDTKRIIRAAVALDEVAAKDNAAAQLGDSQMKIAQELAMLKTMTAAGKDHDELKSAIKYLEAGAIMIGRIIQRNIQKP